MQDDAAIIAGCRKGDRIMQRKLFEKYAPQMKVVCHRYCKGIQEAEDVLQESFIKVFKHLDQYRQEAPFPAWIKRIVVNTALNHQRGKLYLFPMVDVDELKNAEIQTFPLANYHYKELLAIIQTLPTGCQMVFNLYAIEGYQHKEIAKMMNISEGTSKSQYARAKMLLKEMIEKAEHLRYEKFR